jgi:hypothetical protein
MKGTTVKSRNTRAPRRALSRAAAIAATAALAAGGALVATAPASAADGSTVTDAVLDWGLSGEVGGGAFFGGCNFLSAGTAGNAGSSRLWTEADGFLKASDGAVSVVKPTSTGSLQPITWANKCLNPSGTAVSSTSTTNLSGVRVQVADGQGTVAADGSVDIHWDGSFTVVFYGGLTYWTASDPHLTIDADGDGQLTATASGFGASMDDATKWDALPSREIVLADISSADVSDGGFTVTPDYLGVAVNTGSGTPQNRTAASWGSFPQSFVDYQALTGQSSYWYSSGASRDAAKPATPLTVSYTAEEVTTPQPGAGDITVDVPAAPEQPSGAFGWQWASSSPVDLGTAAEQSGNFVATGTLNDIQVTDTRTGGTTPYTWSISGQVSDFASGSGSFGGGYLGWTPKVVQGGTAVTAGAAVSSTLAGGAGLAQSATLASSTSAASAVVGADLSLVIPGSTPAGSYAATLTVTALQ